MSNATFTRTKTFKTERDALRMARALNLAPTKYGCDKGDRFRVTPSNDHWIIIRELADSSFSMPLQETRVAGVSFGKPEGGIMSGGTTQSILRDGDEVGTIECVWDTDYESPCSRTEVRKGTEEYVVTFNHDHALGDVEFHFEVQYRDAGQRVNPGFGFKHYVRKPKTATLDPEHGIYGVVYPDARKALAAAKRFAKAVLS